MPSWSGQSCAREKVRQYGEKRRSEREEAHPVAEVIWEETDETADETAEATDEVAAAEEAEEELRAKDRVNSSVAPNQGEGRGNARLGGLGRRGRLLGGGGGGRLGGDRRRGRLGCRRRSCRAEVERDADADGGAVLQEGRSSARPVLARRTKEDQERTSPPTAAPAWSSSAEHSPCMQLDTSVRNVSDEHRHWMSLDAHDVEPAAEAMQVTTLRVQENGESASTSRSPQKKDRTHQVGTLTA